MHKTLHFLLENSKHFLWHPTSRPLDAPAPFYQLSLWSLDCCLSHLMHNNTGGNLLGMTYTISQFPVVSAVDCFMTRRFGPPLYWGSKTPVVRTIFKCHTHVDATDCLSFCIGYALYDCTTNILMIIRDRIYCWGDSVQYWNVCGIFKLTSFLSCLVRSER